MQLTEKQIGQANALIEKYGFCSLETQGELQEAGFFEKQVVQHYIVFPDDPPKISEPFVGVHEDIDYYAENDYDYILFPTFHEVWEALPSEILINFYNHKRCILGSKVFYAEEGDGVVSTSCVDFEFTNENITEAAALLWLKLKKENLI